MASRESWDSYFVSMAMQVATRSTCRRRMVGALITQHNRVRATGYNGGPSGYGHCLDGACPRGAQEVLVSDEHVPGERGFTSAGQVSPDYADCIAIHAEANALLQCDSHHREGATIYCTDFPCFSCAKLIASSGIGRVVYVTGQYEDWERVRDFLRECRVRVGEPNGA